ncbi:MAG: succinate dehydrogenase assembly factor 2 [Burkholderiaceae bacterium]|nr:succinate dehydrogenase assembly factor 2 [Burkholderiaceae bacterium]
MIGADALPLARKRLRWRARRGLLENDLILARFFNRYGDVLTADEINSIETLLDLPENELLDLLLARTELPPEIAVAPVRSLLQRLRSV